MLVAVTSGFSTTSVLLLSFLSLWDRGVSAHGYLSKPQARNVPNNGDRQSLSAGGPSTVLSGGQYRHGMCGDKWDADQKWNVPGPIQATYQAGDDIDLEVTVTAHHLGWFDFQVCQASAKALSL